MGRLPLLRRLGVIKTQTPRCCCSCAVLLVESSHLPHLRIAVAARKRSAPNLYPPTHVSQTHSKPKRLLQASDLAAASTTRSILPIFSPLPIHALETEPHKQHTVLLFHRCFALRITAVATRESISFHCLNIRLHSRQSASNNLITILPPTYQPYTAALAP